MKNPKANDIVFHHDPETGMLNKVVFKHGDPTLKEAMGETIHGKNPNLVARADIERNLQEKGIKYKVVEGPNGEEHLEVENGKDCTPQTIPVGFGIK